MRRGEKEKMRKVLIKRIAELDEKVIILSQDIDLVQFSYVFNHYATLKDLCFINIYQ